MITIPLAAKIYAVFVALLIASTVSVSLGRRAIRRRRHGRRIWEYDD